MNEITETLELYADQTLTQEETNDMIYDVSNSVESAKDTVIDVIKILLTASSERRRVYGLRELLEELDMNRSEIDSMVEHYQETEKENNR